MKRKITERIENGFFDDVDYQMVTRGYQMVEGKCCARCVHRYGDKMDYCVRHNFDDKCYGFKLAKGLFLKK